MAIPTKDADLAQYSQNFQTRGTSAPGDFGLTSLQMTQFTSLNDPWIAAYNAVAEGGRSPALVAAKNQAKADLLPYARELYASIQNSQTVSDENKTLMGVTIKKTHPTPTPPPALSPKLTIISVTGRTVKCQVEDRAFPNTKRRPANALGVTIMSATGDTPPPASDPGWVLEGQSGKNIFDVVFADSVAAGTKCWIVALWYSRRGAYSPACEPVQTYLQVGPAAEAA